MASRERAAQEASLLGIIGPDTAPELYETFATHDERGGGGGGGGGGAEQHVLVMEAADSLWSGRPSLARFCAQRQGRAVSGAGDDQRLALRVHAQRLVQCVLNLHNKNLVHCDLKTKHFLRFHGEWKLVDYGSVPDPCHCTRPNAHGPMHTQCT